MAPVTGGEELWWSWLGKDAQRNGKGKGPDEYQIESINVKTFWPTIASNIYGVSAEHATRGAVGSAPDADASGSVQGSGAPATGATASAGGRETKMECWEGGGTSLGELGGEGGSGVGGGGGGDQVPFNGLEGVGERDEPVEAIFTPNSSSFSSIFQAYIRNLRFNTSTTQKPFLIVTAFHVSHVQASVICAKRHDLLMKIRSGGHGYEGVSYVAAQPFFLLDMFNLRSIEVNMDTETAWVEAGATLGEVYYRIAEKSEVHGFPAGIGPTVGVGGRISGGGYGNLMRKYGTSVDNVVDAQVVDVQGRLLNRSSMGEDLFWAIRGGGGGSFGVVLVYKIKLVRVPERATVFQVERTLEQDATNIVYNG
ncbi:hypothetical protein JHK84_042677 [Glycine max]|nr:hypothetical protein JHK84_042677 [Glycine max]